MEMWTKIRLKALMSSEAFVRVQEQMAADAHRPTPLKVAMGRVYPLSGLVRCSACG